MSTLIKPKKKWLARKVVKSTTASDKGGHSGNGSKPPRHRKHHARARQPQGYPQGTCAKLGFKGTKQENPCVCGTHHPNNRKFVRYI